MSNPGQESNCGFGANPDENLNADLPCGATSDSASVTATPAAARIATRAVASTLATPVAPTPARAPVAAPAPDARASRLRVFDLHCDTLVSLFNTGEPNQFVFDDFTQQTELEMPASRSLNQNDLQVSLQRMQTIDWCQCFAVFIPEQFSGELAWHFYRQIKRSFDRQLLDHADRMAQVINATDIEEVLAARQCAALLTIEGAAFLQNSLDHIDDLAADHVKMLALTWNNQNALASGTQATGGLTNFGRQAVRALQQHQIVIDVSHLNDQSFNDLTAATEGPLVASHSNSRAVCDHPRNLTDAQFRTICERGGLVGLNFHNDFITTEQRRATPDDLLRHIDHWLTLDGMHCIALGSDYDGADLPDWINSCDKLPDLYNHVQRAFDSTIADRLFFANAQRFWQRH